jgi:hypothetical protein
VAFKAKEFSLTWAQHTKEGSAFVTSLPRVQEQGTGLAHLPPGKRWAVALLFHMYNIWGSRHTLRSTPAPTFLFLLCPQLRIGE